MENREQYISNIRFIGMIDYSQHAMIVGQNNNNIRLKLKILSDSCEHLPFRDSDINVFSNDISTLKIFDSLKGEEKKNEVSDYLFDQYLIFNVKKTNHSDPTKDAVYYNATNIELRKMNETAQQNDRFKAIHFISTTTVEKIKETLIQKQYRTVVMDEMYLEIDDIELVCLTKADLKEEGFLDFTFMGDFKGNVINEKHGIKLNYENELKEIVLDKKEIGNYYISDKNIIFLEDKIVERIKLDLQKNGEKKYFISQSQTEEAQDEEEFIEYFYSICLKKGLVYSKKDLINFHTSMKTKSFVILAGMSGTGKSQLIQCYSMAIHSEIKNNRLLFIPVKPSWQDDSDLLGYLDTVNSVYRPGETGLVQFLKEASLEENKNECYIVCLDEMNLSRIEHYFSQFLSILERNSEDRSINLYNIVNSSQVYNANDFPKNIKISENVFFVGTINTDETTHKFSDKVLDRSNVIEIELQNFAEIKNKLSNFNSEKIDEESIRFNQPSFTKFKGMVALDSSGKLRINELNLLWDIHKIINKKISSSGIGMRIVNQIEKYLNNLPKGSLISREEALDIQLVQRVFTKISGSQSLLKELVNIKEEVLEGEILDLLLKYEIENLDEGISFEKSKRKLLSLAMELKEYGHTI